VLEELRRALQGTDLRCLAGRARQHLVVLAETSIVSAALDVLAPLGPLGISDVSTERSTLPACANNAVTAFGLACRREQPAVFYDAARTDRLLTGELAAPEFVRGVLAPLASLPDGREAQARETLRAYLECQGSVTAAAEELIMHRQSVQYRLRKLKELFGDSLDDPERRLELQLALRLDELSASA
jgi:DNA-binding PucR family transcriptional regulator